MNPSYNVMIFYEFETTLHLILSSMGQSLNLLFSLRKFKKIEETIRSDRLQIC